MASSDAPLSANHAWCHNLLSKAKKGQSHSWKTFKDDRVNEILELNDLILCLCLIIGNNSEI